LCCKLQISCLSKQSLKHEIMRWKIEAQLDFRLPAMIISVPAMILFRSWLFFFVLLQLDSKFVLSDSIIYARIHFYNIFWFINSCSARFNMFCTILILLIFRACLESLCLTNTMVLLKLQSVACAKSLLWFC
jgi:hypothetical protein